MDEAVQTFLTFLQEGKVDEAGEFLAAHLGLDPEEVCGELELIVMKAKQLEPAIAAALEANDYEGAAALIVVAADYKLNHAYVVECLKERIKNEKTQRANHQTCPQSQAPDHVRWTEGKLVGMVSCIHRGCRSPFTGD